MEGTQQDYRVDFVSWLFCCFGGWVGGWIALVVCVWCLVYVCVYGPVLNLIVAPILALALDSTSARTPTSATPCSGSSSSLARRRCVQLLRFHTCLPIQIWPHTSANLINQSPQHRNHHAPGARSGVGGGVEGHARGAGAAGDAGAEPDEAERVRRAALLLLGVFCVLFTRVCCC